MRCKLIYIPSFQLKSEMPLNSVEAPGGEYC